MKEIILIMFMLLCIATSSSAEKLNVSQVKNDLQSELNNDIFEGELANLGGECKVRVEEITDENSKGRVIVKLTGRNRISLHVFADPKDVITVRTKTLDDGSSTSYVKTYRFPLGQKVVKSHIDDGGETWSVEDTSTRLTCQFLY